MASDAKSMIIVLPMYFGDLWLAQKNLEWMIELDGKAPYECVISCDTKTEPKEVTALAKTFFTKVHQFRYDRLRGDSSWPRAQNHSFMSSCWFMYHNFPKRSFLWAETDACPTRPGWLQAIEECHINGRKPFSGHWNYATGVFNGVAVYPWNISSFAPKAMTASLVEGYQPPWDVYCSKEIERYLTKANHLFQHIWRDDTTGEAHTFPTRESVRDVIRPGVVLFHRCKDGSLYQWRDELDAIQQQPVSVEFQVGIERPSIALVYVYPSSGFESAAVRFIDSYIKHPPEFPHSAVVVVNGGNATTKIKKLFEPLKPSYFLHDNSGWDIGAFIAAASKINTEAMLCLGANTHFKRAGWLKRYVEAWRKLGPGMYGTLASNEVRPHICTTGFLTPPELLRAYPYKVDTQEDRYEFEWGKGAFWRRVQKAGMPVKMVTWDGVWGMDQLRVPPNIYRRGDQSNCLVYFRHSDAYDAADPATKKRMEGHADNPPKQACQLQQRVDAVSRELAPI
jgi:hypothetical protein